MVGGKAANLGEMIKAGLPVPEGFAVLTNGYRNFVEQNGIDQTIRALLEGVDKHDIANLEKISKEIKRLFETNEIPRQIREEIETNYQNLGGTDIAVAIRSSSTAEDLPGISFAGQYDTYLNIKGQKEVCRSVKKCWASLWNARAISYRMEQNIDCEEIGHGVVVQRLIDSEISGILFTVNPLNGRRDQILINSSWGLGEAIVGGEVTPDQWAVNKKSGDIVEEKIAQKDIMVVKKDDGIDFIKVANDKQKETTLDKNGVREMLSLALRVEAYFGSPQDIEWAYSDNRFYLVQSRPVTSLYPMPRTIDKKKDLRVFINLNNYSQAMKEPFTPMGENVIRSIADGLVTKYAKKSKQDDKLWWYQVLGGRVFIDITDFMRTEKSWDKFKKNDTADKDPLTTKALLQLIERNRDGIINPSEAINLKKLVTFRLLKLMIGMGLKYRLGIKAPVRARTEAKALGDRIISELNEERNKVITIEDKINLIREKSSKTFTDGFGIVSYIAASSTYIEKAKSIMDLYLDDTSDLSFVEKSVPYSVTTEMGMEILLLAKNFAQKGKRPTAIDPEIKEFLQRHGHRASIDLEVGVPVWREDPQYVLDLINNYIDNQNYQEAIDRFNQGRIEAEKAILRIRDKLTEKGQEKKAREIEKLLRDFREMFGMREQSKFFLRQFFTILREMLLEIGEQLQNEGKLEDKSDVFFVTMDDIMKGLDLKRLVKINKEQFRIDYKKTAPRLMTSTGECIYAPISEVSENSLLGIPVSPGVYEGEVRVLESPEDGNKLQKGEILVTTGTNPSWTPLFLKLGGLIMETGGPISHGSVVAREYGVPAVAGVAKATRILRDGQMVRINGETGTVELI
jgi:pyruvate,water dikinase